MKSDLSVSVGETSRQWEKQDFSLLLLKMSSSWDNEEYPAVLIVKCIDGLFSVYPKLRSMPVL